MVVPARKLKPGGEDLVEIQVMYAVMLETVRG